MAAKVSTDENGIALNGIDVTTYRDGQVSAGTSDYTQEWEGATFWFVSKRNQEAFLENPLAYIPQYGGHCAFAMGFGKTAHADPKVFTCVDDKIYLNASPMVRRFWRWFGNITKADANWENLEAPND